MSEPDGFRDYVAARQQALLRMAWLLTGDWQTAEDVVQTALAKVWPRWQRIVRQGEPDGYVRQAVVNTFLSWRRRRWHGERPAARPPDGPAGGDAYATADLRDALARLLLTLPPRQRAVLVLRYYQDLSEVETARILDCSVGTVKSQASRGLARLRAAMAIGALVEEDVR